MKTPKYILLALALGICSAGAITMEILHDTPKKLTVELDWHPGVFGSLIYQGTHFVQFDLTPFQIDEQYDDYLVDLYAFGPVFGNDNFTVGKRGITMLRFERPSDLLDKFVSIVDLTDPLMKVAPDQMSARWTFRLPAVPVPDAGSTLLLLGMVLGMLGFMRKAA